jgi:NTE family protein
VSHVGLVLTGGGARAAYQVGAIKALAEIVGPDVQPFDVLTGISAGAINAIGLGMLADDFQTAAQRLGATWCALTPDRVYRTGALRLARIGTRWLRDLSTGGLVGKTGINFLLDPSPLRELIEKELLLGRMRRHVRKGRLRGVAVSTTNYNTGNGVTFFEAAPEVEPWTRSTRVGLRARITADHVMASAAIPVFFPPVRIQGSFFGDGCVRMHYPMSPAIHLGADKIVAISQRYLRAPAESAARELRANASSPMPMSEIAGVLLNAVFLDSLDSDLERLNRINRTLQLVPRSKLENGDEYHRFPAMLRYFLKGIGATGQSGEDLLSYLAFEPIYVRRVMDLGYADTIARRDEVAEFLQVPQRKPARSVTPASA